MARRRYRKGRSRRRFRTRSVVRKALSIARSVSRKVAGEVRKSDNCARIVNFTQLTPNGGSGNLRLPDFGSLYTLFTTDLEPGYNIDDFAGSQIRLKYLYLGFHLQTINASAGATSLASSAVPVTMRIIVFQDRNYGARDQTAGQQLGSIGEATQALFGIPVVTSASSSEDYYNHMDLTLLPYNPYQPGRFKILRDFTMSVAPGWKCDTVKRMTFLQRDLSDSGRIYFGGLASTVQRPGDVAVKSSVARGQIYVAAYYSIPFNATDGTPIVPLFNFNIQSRLAYYDN